MIIWPVRFLFSITLAGFILRDHVFLSLLPMDPQQVQILVPA